MFYLEDNCFQPLSLSEWCALTSDNGNSQPRDASQSDAAFQKLLLELSRAAFQSSDTSQLIQSFCALTRAFFHASGAYFWRCSSGGELVGAEADGDPIEPFRGIRLRTADSSNDPSRDPSRDPSNDPSDDPSDDPSIALEAVHRRRPFFLNHVDAARYRWLADRQAHAAMAAPLLVSGEVIGAIAFVHSAPDAAFNDDSVAKVTILAAQLGTALEALRLSRV